MARSALASAKSAEPLFLRPWVVLLAGIGLIVLGLALSSLDEHAATVVRAMALAVGLFVVGAALGRRLQTAGVELEQRIETSGMLALGAFAALLAYLAIKKPVLDSAGKVLNPGDDCSTGEYFLAGLIVIALFGALLVVLPTLWRKVVASLLIVFHFGGIFVAIINVAPPGATSPWITEQLWAGVYRHYLGYTYMTNAYHFYSPEPGPTTLVWFRLEYADGSYRWVKFPDKKEAEVPLAYTRRMVLGDGTVVGPQVLPPALFNLRARDRREAGFLFVPEPTPSGEKFKGVPIPLVPEDLTTGFNLNMPVPGEAYKEPNEFGKTLTASYARHVARSYPHTGDPSIPVKNVKVYSITHRIMAPNEMAANHNEMEETYLVAYYMGTFDPEGKLLYRQQQYDEQGQPLLKKKDVDGFLYWTVPVIILPKNPGGDLRYPFESKDVIVRNYLYLHAGDIRAFDDIHAQAEPSKPIKGEGRP